MKTAIYTRNNKKIIYSLLGVQCPIRHNREKIRQKGYRKYTHWPEEPWIKILEKSHALKNKSLILHNRHTEGKKWIDLKLKYQMICTTS